MPRTTLRSALAKMLQGADATDCTGRDIRRRVAAGLLLALGIAAAAARAGEGPARADRHGDPLPDGARARLGTTRLRGVAVPLAFSPDGKLLATAAYDGESGAAILWDRATDREVRRLRTGERGSARALSFSPDGRRLAASTSGPHNPVFEVSSGRVLYSFSGEHATFSADGKFLVSADGGSNAPQVRVWEAATGRPLRSLALTQGAEQFGLAADSRTLAVVDRAAPSYVQVLDLATGKELRRLDVGGPGRWWMTLGPDGKTLATAGEKEVRLWGVATGKEIRRWKRRPDSAPVFAPDGKRLAWNGYDEERGIARAWVVGLDEERPRALGTPTNSFDAPCFSPDGKVLAVPYDGKAVLLRDVATGRDLLPLEAHASPVVRVSPALERRVIVSRDRNDVIAWDWPTGRLLRRYPVEPPAGEGAVALLPGGRVLSGIDGGAFRVRDAAPGRELVRLEGKHSTGWLAVSDDGSAAALLGDGLGVFDLATGKARFRTERRGEPYGFGLSADGRLLLRLFEKEEKVRIVVTDTRAGRDLPLPGLDGLRWASSFIAPRRCLSPDARWLVFPGGAGDLRRWDVAAARELPPLRGAPASVHEVFFSPDGRLVAVRGSDSPRGGTDPYRPFKVRALDLATGRALDHLDPTPSPSDMPAFSRDGRTLFTTNYGTISLWEVATGQLRVRLSGHVGWVGSLATAPDGRTLFSGGDDTQVLAWDLTARASAGLAAPDQLRAWWDALSGGDPVAAWRAVGALASSPGESVPFLREHLQPVPSASPGRVEKLIAELDGAKFAARQRAAEELEAMGEPVAGLLRKALSRAATLESRRRLEQLLEKVDGAVPSGARLQALRAVEALEYDACWRSWRGGRPGRA